MLLLLLSACADGSDRLARQVAHTAGDPSALGALSFTFQVVEPDGGGVRRHHTWCPTSGLVRTEAAGEVRHGRFGVDDTPALRWFGNDQYWLLGPTKLFDPGVRRSLAPGGELVLEFDGVGTTPGDRFELTVDGDGRVESWSFVLQDGRSDRYAWSDFVRQDGLLLSLRRVNAAGREIRFSDIEGHARCPL